MLLFLGCGLLEDVGDLHEPIFPCNPGKVGVAVARLALAGERFQEVLLGSASLDAVHQKFLRSWSFPMHLLQMP